LSEPFRCAAASLQRDEALLGTASTVRAFLLVEDIGPWGVDAVRDCRSLGAVCTELLDRAHHHRVRVLLIRRHGRSQPDGIRVFAAYTHLTRSWLETTTVSTPEELLDLDLARLGTGVRLGMSRHDEPLFCVCTHGRHDVCCAERGRPVAAALTAAYPEQTWEVSHIGGDRFAGNVLVFPEGLYYGRVTPESAPDLAAGHLGGRLDLDRLRGRSCYPFTVQAAETMLRVHLGVVEAYAVGLDGHRRVWPAPDPSTGSATRSADRLHEVDFAVTDASGPATRWRVTLRTHPAQPTALTCRATRETAAPTYSLIGIQQIDA
jgi:hypothetical protein